MTSRSLDLSHSIKCWQDKDDPDEDRTWFDVGKQEGLVVVGEEDAEVEIINTTAQDRHQKLVKGNSQHSQHIHVHLNWSKLEPLCFNSQHSQHVHVHVVQLISLLCSRSSDGRCPAKDNGGAEGDGDGLEVV